MAGTPSAGADCGAGEGGEALTPGKVREFLGGAKGKTREELVAGLESVGLKVKGRSADGHFMEFVDKQGRIRAKIHPPDKVTKDHHIHIFDSKGNPLDASLAKASRRSPDAHIPIQEP